MDEIKNEAYWALDEEKYFQYIRTKYLGGIDNLTHEERVRMWGSDYFAAEKLRNKRRRK